jgi:hypothetical protein
VILSRFCYVQCNLCHFAPAITAQIWRTKRSTAASVSPLGIRRILILHAELNEARRKQKGRDAPTNCFSQSAVASRLWNPYLCPNA